MRAEASSAMEAHTARAIDALKTVAEGGAV